MADPSEKAKLYRLVKKVSGPKKEPFYELDEKTAITVQFNPSSLSLQHPNSKDDGGKTVGAQKRQYPSAGPSTLTFTLEFDTAELADGGGPLGVRSRTAPVIAFARPAAQGGGEPTAMSFVWGSFRYDGLVDKITEELDFFSSDGRPLRAGLTLSMTEQNLAFEKNELVPARWTDRLADLPGASPGRSGTGRLDRVITARDGESVQQLAARVQGDPAAWRSLMNGLENPLGLAPGTPVQAGPELSGSGGPGRAAGFAAAPPDVLAGPVRDAEAAGFVLSRAGGIARLAAEAAAARTERAVREARAAFGAVQSAAAAGELDPRALTFGAGLPLRARAQARTLAEIASAGRTALASRARPAEAAPTVTGGPPWEALPATGREISDGEQRRRDTRPSTMRWKPGGAVR
jgi:hypothetical protein